MPGIRHEAVVELVHRFPQLLAALLRNAEVPVPEGPVTEVDSNLSARRPLVLLAESVFLLGQDKPKNKRSNAGDRLAVVVEVQSSRPSLEKRRDWAAYLAIASREHECDALVLVLALSRETARLSRRPFRIGPGNTLAVVVIGPNDLPDEVPGLDTQLKVLAAVNGALDLEREQGRVAVLDAIAAAVAEDQAGYARLILAIASDHARAELEVLMATAHKETLVDRLLAQGEATGEAKGEARGEARGKAIGEANLLLRALHARGLDVPADVRDMVTSCTDTAQLEAWFDRAITAASLEDVFGRQ